MADVKTPVWTFSPRRWKIDIISHQPVELHDTEFIDNKDVRPVIYRCYTQVARTSFMVNGPNREVYWTISQWNDKRRVWEEIASGRSKVKDRPLKQRYPDILR
jgi:hypothetical protein